MIEPTATFKDHPGPNRLAFVDQGDGPPVVLLHAFPLDGRMWQRQIDSLRDGWRVVVPDLRGFGRSPRTSGESTRMRAYARDVVRLLDTLSIETACVCGLSMGGYVALAFAEQFPERLAGLILANTRAGADSDPAREGRQKLAQRVGREGVAALAEALLAKLLSPNAPEAAEADARGMILAQDPRGAISAILGMAGRQDRSGLLSSLATPTLVITSSSDALVPPSESKAMSDAIPGARLVEIADAGHLSNLEAPASFNQATRGFLQTL